MTVLVVDASVWVAAAESNDRFWALSRDFLNAATKPDITVAVPEFAELEVACALARRLRNPSAGRRLCGEVLQIFAVHVHSTDTATLRSAVTVGTGQFLRAGDAVYATLAKREGALLISWDHELVSRAGAITPEQWLKDQS